jgi:hypothetical protein
MTLAHPRPPEADGTDPDGRPSRLRRWLPLLLVVQVLLAILALAVWIWTPDAPPLPHATTETAPLVRGGATIESALALAQAQADAWLPGAVLLNASMQVDWPWTVPPGQTEDVPDTGWLTYVFVAPWDPPGRPPGAASLGITVERLSGAIVNRESTGWAEAPEFREPPPPAPIDSRRATLIADRRHGADFRRACPEHRHLSRTFPVAAERTEWPQHWVVIYEDSRAPAVHGLLVRIDAETGDVLESEERAPACP